jgi:hypothetical protein
MALLAILARHPELPAVDGDADLSHFSYVVSHTRIIARRVIRCLLAELQRAANSFDGPINSLRNFAMDGFECLEASRRIVEVVRKPRDRFRRRGPD